MKTKFGEKMFFYPQNTSKITQVRWFFCGFLFISSFWAVQEEVFGQDQSPISNTNQAIQWSLGAIQATLGDVQDFTSSLDQAGLYALLHAPQVSHATIVSLDDPCQVLAQPDQYRGNLLQFKALINNSIVRLELSRPRLYDRQIYYAAGRIPFGENQAMPAIFIFPRLPLKTPINAVTLEGFFYMVLRTETQEVNPSNGPTTLDFLVFVVPNPPDESALTETTTNRRGFPVSFWISVGGVIMLGLLWVILRKVTRPAARPEMQKRAVWAATMTEAKTEKVKTDNNFTGRVVPVELGERSYPIYIGRECLGELGRLVTTHVKCQRALVVTDRNVAPLYAKAALDSLQEAGVEEHLAVVDAGEASKSAGVLGLVYDRMFEAQMERRDPVIALGGGVVGDLAGYAAATYKRGVPFVQVPTSLLAMVDSSIGGKTAINHPRGKNMIGAFYQPRFVLADVATLQTLPLRELGCGLAETVKHGVIRDAAFFAWLEEHVEEILGLRPEVMAELVERNCRIKAAVVGADEREAGLRGILNLGHTIGHAIETVLKDRDIHHGEAVSLGLVAALRLAVNRGLMTSVEADRVVALLQAFKLPVTLKGEIPVEEIYNAMRQDKKVSAGKITFVLPRKIGDCGFCDDIGITETKNIIASLGA
ncbi:MAG: 3-dehydroquinate synthase [Sedimentisphaerales bacterium]|nr:3-dehydroquinate synthase [Sedimentisphaerales bacterium]